MIELLNRAVGFEMLFSRFGNVYKKATGKLRFLFELTHRHGPPGLIRTVISKIMPRTRRFFVYELSVPRIGHQIHPPFPDTSFAFATQPELENLRKTGGWNIFTRDLDAAARGDRCLLARVGHQVAGYTWVAGTNTIRLPSGWSWDLPEDTAYEYNTFTAPEFRGRGLQGAMNRALLNELSQEGISRTVLYVDWLNFSSQKGVEKAGYIRVGRVVLKQERTRKSVAVKIRKDLVGGFKTQTPGEPESGAGTPF